MLAMCDGVFADVCAAVGDLWEAAVGVCGTTVVGVRVLCMWMGEDQRGILNEVGVGSETFNAARTHIGNDVT